MGVQMFLHLFANCIEIFYLSLCSLAPSNVWHNFFTPKENNCEKERHTHSSAITPNWCRNMWAIVESTIAELKNLLLPLSNLFNQFSSTFSSRKCCWIGVKQAVYSRRVTSVANRENIPHLHWGTHKYSRKGWSSPLSHSPWKTHWDHTLRVASVEEIKPSSSLYHHLELQQQEPGVSLNCWASEREESHKSHDLRQPHLNPQRWHGLLSVHIT